MFVFLEGLLMLERAICAMARKLALSFVCVVLFLFVGNIYCWLESIMGDVCSGFC